LPPCDALIVQVPAATKVAVVPETVQMLVVVEAKLTVRPEVAVAERVSGVPTVWAAIMPNAMVWPSGVGVILSPAPLCEPHPTAAKASPTAKTLSIWRLEGVIRRIRSPASLDKEFRCDNDTTSRQSEAPAAWQALDARILRRTPHRFSYPKKREPQVAEARPGVPG